MARLPGSVSAAKDLSSLFERFVGSTCSSDSPLAFMLVVRLIAFSSRSALLLPDTNGVSRFSRMRFPDMPGVCDCAGSTSGTRFSSLIVWPSDSPNIVGTPNVIDFAAQYPACLCPCQRFACNLTDARA